MEEREYLAEAFAGLSEEAKGTIILIGIEAFLRAYTFNTTGWKTLRGAMYYVPEDSRCLCDVLLHALDGNDECRKKLQRFMLTDHCREIAVALHPLSQLKIRGNHAE